MTTTPRSLRTWLTCALLGILILPPLVVWTVHLSTASTTGPDAGTLAAARAFAVDNVNRWTDPAWRRTARASFTADHVDAELRPARGAWFTTRATPLAAGSIHPSDKFAVHDPRHPGVLLGSGWIIPHTTVRTTWPLALLAGALTLTFTVAAAGTFLGRHVVRPLAAMSRAASGLPHGVFDPRLPSTRVREVAATATALRTMDADLRALLGQQADLDEQRRQFIGAVAHDLRTPLFALRAHLDGLRDGLATSPEKTNRYLRVCRASADALNRLVTDLFTYARMEFLDQRPHYTSVDVTALLRAAALAHAPQADTKHLTMTVRAPADPCTILGDEHLLARAVDNLLDNAVRHTPDGGRIDLHCEQNTDELTISVTDTGPGIAPHDLPHLFTPLYRGDTSRNRATGGAGLGLTIAHRILLAHHGTLTARNNTPHGARFTARIPVRPQATQPLDTEPLE